MKRTVKTVAVLVALIFAMSIPVFAETANYYVSGDFNGYTNPDENFAMTKIGDGTYSVTQKIPAGDHIYKVTNGTWDAEGCFGKESYANPKPYAIDTGAFGNILFKTDAEQDVTFFFNENTKKVADSTFYTFVEPYIVGDFFSEMSIGDDWDASKATTLLTDPEFDNIYTGTFKIPAGKYGYKVTIGKAWDLSYGVDGATEGMDTGMVLELAAETDVTFTFDGSTHITTISTEKAEEAAPAVEPAAPAETAGENPKTGDFVILVPILSLTASLAGIVLLRRKLSVQA